MLRVALMATLDTKAAEVRHMAQLLQSCGAMPVIVDVGVYPTDLVHADVRLASGLAGLRRDAAMERLGRAAAELLDAWVRAGEIDGVVGLGGNQGTAICGLARLPHGFPRIVVSTIALADVREHFQDADVFLVFPVADLVGGPNPVNEPVLRNAIVAMVAMAEAYRARRREAASAPSGRGRPVIGLTAFGNTQAAVTRAMQRLADAGYECVAFHASGGGGPSLDRLVRDGLFQGVLDLTPHELLAELYPDDIYRPIRPGRLMAALERGVPSVIAPGALNYFCFGSVEEIPEGYRDRAIHHHNPYNTNVRANAEECARVGGELARRVNGARGPVAVLFPRQGWSENTRPGQPLYDPASDAALVDAFMALRQPHVWVEFIDANINDPPFVDRAVSLLQEMLASD